MVSDAKILESYNQGSLTQPCGCTPGTPGCGWATGDMRTAIQDAWGDPTSNDGAVLQANFNSVYPNDLVVGGNFTLALTQSGATFAFLPALGTPGALNGSISDPQTTSAGEFGGEVVALQLNVDFSSVFGNSTDFGSLLICNVSSVPSLNGQTVNQFLATANHLLGGGSASIGLTTANALARLLNGAFADGAPSTFAQNNLRVGGCGWQQGDMRTAIDSEWGDGASALATLLGANFSTIYAGTGLVVGGTNTMTFDTSSDVIAYLPASGNSGVLSFSLVNPLTSSAGEFGGQVVALQLNVDFSAVFGNSVPLGDLRLCNFTAVPSVNGQTIGDFLATANALLGGGVASFGPTTGAAVASLINSAFANGTPSTFAQANLVDGSCPP